MAEETMVYESDMMASPSEGRHLSTGSLATSERVADTLFSRKGSTAAIYYKVWRTYNQWLHDNRVVARAQYLSVLDFLQAGLDLNLSRSTLKIRISALSVFLDQRLATMLLIQRFFKAVYRKRPSLRNFFPFGIFQWC